MFKESYKHIYDRILPEDNLMTQTIAEAQNLSVKYSRPIYKIRKPLLVAAIVVVLCAALAVTPVLASTNDTIYQIMYSVSPSIAQFFVPVQKSCVDNGIEMSVLATYIHDETVEIYITMRDTTEDRLDSKVDLFDSYSINTAFDCSGNCELVGYDEITKTATFLITLSQWEENSGNKKDITGDKLTFSVKSLITGKETYIDYNVPIDLSLVEKTPETQKQYVDLMNGISDVAMDVLIPQKKYTETDFGDLYFSGFGFVDGELHIQMVHENYLENDNHCWIYLREKSDNSNSVVDKNSDDSISPAISISWVEDGKEYYEYVFDLGAEGQEVDYSAYDSYDLCGDFYTSNNAIHGNWKITFPIENNTNETACIEYSLE
jgi:hypothetical protein